MPLITPPPSKFSPVRLRNDQERKSFVEMIENGFTHEEALANVWYARAFRFFCRVPYRLKEKLLP